MMSVFNGAYRVAALALPNRSDAAEPTNERVSVGAAVDAGLYEIQEIGIMSQRSGSPHCFV